MHALAGKKWYVGRENGEKIKSYGFDSHKGEPNFN